MLKNTTFVYFISMSFLFPILSSKRTRSKRHLRKALTASISSTSRLLYTNRLPYANCHAITNGTDIAANCIKARLFIRGTCPITRTLDLCPNWSCKWLRLASGSHKIFLPSHSKFSVHVLDFIFTNFNNQIMDLSNCVQIKMKRSEIF